LPTLFGFRIVAVTGGAVRGIGRYFLALAAQFFEPLADYLEIVGCTRSFHRSSLSLSLNLGGASPIM
jgi:hypothetical protein